jgi:hypothetical protein
MTSVFLSCVNKRDDDDVDDLDVDDDDDGDDNYSIEHPWP